MNNQLEFAKTLADEAGKIMLTHFQVGIANDVKPLEGNTPVTVADKAINSMVIAAIIKRYPSHAVLGEEESVQRDNAEYTWVCDPIDGTIPYVMGVPTNVFSIALVDASGLPVVAVVYDPYMKRKYWATKGGGAFMNDIPISVNSISKISDAYIGMSGSRSKIIQPHEFKAALTRLCYRPIILNCAIYEAMLVASGQMAATIFVGSGAHDVASSKLIIEEAGGKVTSVFGEDQRYDRPVNGIISSNRILHDEIADLASNYIV